MRFTRLLIMAVVGLALTLSATADVTVTNIEVSTGQAYEFGGVVEEGAAYFIDRAHAFGVLPEDPAVAEDIARAVFIKQGNDQKASVGPDFLTFTVETDEGGFRVWILRDIRGDEARAGVPPEWMTTDFERTGVQFPVVGDDNMGFFIIYKGIEVMESGANVSLGGNADPPSVGQGTSYLTLITEEAGLAVEPAGKLTTAWGMLKSR